MWWSLMSRGRGTEERNSFSYENRHASDNVTLNEPRSPEPLNRDPTVDVEVVGTTRSEFVERAGLPVGGRRGAGRNETTAGETGKAEPKLLILQTASADF